jgi:hypothetical protein
LTEQLAAGEFDAAVLRDRYRSVSRGADEVELLRAKIAAYDSDLTEARENICQLQATVQEKDMLLQDIGAALQTRLREVRESQARTWSMVHMYLEEEAAGSLATRLVADAKEKVEVALPNADASGKDVLQAARDLVAATRHDEEVVHLAMKSMPQLLRRLEEESDRSRRLAEELACSIPPPRVIAALVDLFRIVVEARYGSCDQAWAEMSRAGSKANQVTKSTFQFFCRSLGPHYASAAANEIIENLWRVLSYGNLLHREDFCRKGGTKRSVFRF